MMYDSATRPSNTAASSASAQTKPCASTLTWHEAEGAVDQKPDLRNKPSARK